MMVNLLISQNELWLKSTFKNPADFPFYHDISWYFLTKFLELQFLIQTVANKMCSWNIYAPDASASSELPDAHITPIWYFEVYTV